MPVMMYKDIPYGEGTNTLDGLKDVNISNPSTGDVLKYNSSTGKFENGQLLVGGRIRVNYNVTLFDKTVTTWDNSLTYTATQDCFVIAIVQGDGYSSPFVYVNEENIPFFKNPDKYTHETTLILKKGDTISKRITSDANSIYYRFIVYPIYYDNGGDGSQCVPAVHYSTDEQVVGTWIDGSTVYEKTFHSTTPSAKNTISVIEDISSLNVNNPILLTGNVNNVPINWKLDDDNEVICFVNSAKTGIVMKIANSLLIETDCYLTLRYTKVVTP